MCPTNQAACDSVRCPSMRRIVLLADPVVAFRMLQYAMFYQYIRSFSHSLNIMKVNC